MAPGGTLLCSGPGCVPALPCLRLAVLCVWIWGRGRWRPSPARGLLCWFRLEAFSLYGSWWALLHPFDAIAFLLASTQVLSPILQPCPLLPKRCSVWAVRSCLSPVSHAGLSLRCLIQPAQHLAASAAHPWRPVWSWSLTQRPLGALQLAELPCHGCLFGTKLSTAIQDSFGVRLCVLPPPAVKFAQAS